MAKRAEPTVETALEVIETTRLGRWGRALPPHVIRGVLAASSDGPNHLFLRLAVDDEGDDKKLARSWERAVQALVDCSQQDSWGSKTRRARTRALAKNARVLQAIQGTVAHVKEPSDDMLAVLVADGSAASIDALVPHVAKDNLELWKRLRTHAKRTPALDALFAEVEDALDDRAATSPALALGPVIGIGKVDSLWFDASISSDERAGTVARYQGRVKIDSRAAEWFEVSIVDISGMLQTTGEDWKQTQFGSATIGSDDLKLGRCDAAGVPAWLVNAASTLGITWGAPNVRTGLRGTKRDQIGKWLCGGEIPKSPALALGAEIGIGPVDEFWVDITINSRQEAGPGMPRAYVTIKIDSRTDYWFHASVSRFEDGWQHSTLGTPNDDLGLGSCERVELPAWLARAAKRLRVTWKAPKLQSDLRGAKRARILAWLAGD